MALDYAESIVQLLANLVALLLCLFHYISVKQKGWAYGILFFLSSLLSSYYWTAYLVIMGDTPNVSDLMAYFGWNGAFLILFIFLMAMKTPEEKRFFHPMMLFPLGLDLVMLAVFLFFPASAGERQIVTSNVSYFLNNFWLVLAMSLSSMSRMAAPLAR